MMFPDFATERAVGKIRFIKQLRQWLDSREHPLDVNRYRITR